MSTDTSAVTEPTASGEPDAAKRGYPIPTAGKYRIRNVGTGYYLDAYESQQAADTAVIVQTLNQPPTNNQEWSLTFSGGYGSLQSISSFVATTIYDGALAAALLPGIAISLTFSSNQSGVFISVKSTPACYFTSPSGAVNQVSLQPYTGALNQTWIFEPVSKPY